MKKLIVALVSVSSLIACGAKGSPTGPSDPVVTTPPVITPPAATLRSVSLSSTLAKESLPGTTAQVTATGVFSDGRSQNITSTCTDWFSDNPYVATVSSSGMLRVAGSSGQASVTAQCQGMQGRAMVTLNPIPAAAWTRSGTGDTVFDMPTYVKRVKVTADYAQNAQNFMVDVNGRNLVNELMGRGFSQTHFEGTYLTSGGVVEITNSSGVKWSLTEVR